MQEMIVSPRLAHDNQFFYTDWQRWLGWTNWVSRVFMQGGNAKLVQDRP